MYSMIIDLNLVCVVCLQDAGELHSIYEPDDHTPEMSVAEKISHCSEMQPHVEQNKLPDKICTRCLGDLAASWRFRQNCKTASAVFSSIVQQEQEAEAEALANLALEQQRIKLPTGLKIKRIQPETKTYLMPVQFDYDSVQPSTVQPHDQPGFIAELEDERSCQADAMPEDDAASHLNEMVVLLESEEEKTDNEQFEALEEHVDEDRDEEVEEGGGAMLNDDAPEKFYEDEPTMFEAVTDEEEQDDPATADEDGKENAEDGNFPERKPTIETTTLASVIRRRANETVIRHLPRRPRTVRNRRVPSEATCKREVERSRRAKVPRLGSDIDDSEATIKSEPDEFTADAGTADEDDDDDDDEYIEEEPAAGVGGTTSRRLPRARSKMSSLRKSHLPVGRPQKICEICGNTYKYQHALNAHMRRHTNTKPFPCEFCDRAFVSNVELRRHMRVHTGQKPYACQYCERRFSDFGSRIKHERSHTGERPYVCACGKSFAYAHVLTVHMRTHTGEKKFKCSLCPKGFTKKAYLEAHVEQHTRSGGSIKLEPHEADLEVESAMAELNGGELMAIKTVALEECIFTTEYIDEGDDVKPLPLVDQEVSPPHHGDHDHDDDDDDEEHLEDNGYILGMR